MKYIMTIQSYIRCCSKMIMKCIFTIRPSIWIMIITIITYYDNIAMNGIFVYDDAGSISKNVVVNGAVPLHEILYRDYWGTPMSHIQSHKSFRPITTLTFYINYHYFDNVKRADNDPISTYGFHLINILLHGIVSALVTEVSSFIFHNVHNIVSSEISLKQTPSSSSSLSLLKRQQLQKQYENDNSIMIILPQIITGLLFGLHPVHSEAVSNITSRSELLMSMFTLLSFISYASCIQKQKQKHDDNMNNLKSKVSALTLFIGIYIIPWLFMILSLFSKEQGATTLLILLLYDFIINHYSIYDYCIIIWNIVYKKRRRRIRLSSSNEEEKTNDSATSTSYTTTTTDNDSILFLRRSIVLLTQTIITLLFRYYLNGITSPDFIYDQNPAGFHSSRLTRILSIPYIYCLYIYDIILPNLLCPDWSGLSIELITSIYDIRIIYVILLWIVIAICFYLLCFETKKKQFNNNNTNEQTNVQQKEEETKVETNHTKVKMTTTTTAINHNVNLDNNNNNNNEYYYYQYIRNVILISFFSFIICPFLLSSNIFIVIGLMKADRVVYLPLLGFCILQGLLYQILYIRLWMMSPRIIKGQVESNILKQQDVCVDNNTNSKLYFNKVLYGFCYILFMIQMTYYTAKVHERNVAWSYPLNLWVSAYDVNSKSRHTIYNCGYELSLQKRYVEAEYVLRPIASPYVEGPSNTFVYVMVLFNLNRCNEAIPYIEDAFHVIRDKENTIGITPRNTKSSLNRVKSNLLVAKSYCTIDINIKIAGQLMYDAVQVDPTNQYAIDQATLLVHRIDEVNRLNQKMIQQKQKNKISTNI